MREQFEIDLTTKSGRMLKEIIFKTSRGLSNAFAAAFEIQFVDTTEDKIIFLAEKQDEKKVRDAIARMAGVIDVGGHISKDYIRTLANPDAAAASFAGKFEKAAANQNDKAGAHSSKVGGEFRAKTENQQKLAGLIDSNRLIFATGPAGTGKTHVAIAKAVQALKAGTVKKILLARPAMEAGEKIGYLPGDQNEKLAPYMRPLYDELDKTFGPGVYKKMMENGTQLEVVPIGFMRGRTFENAFIIVDEAQNCTKEQLKMAMTRIGPNSKMVVTGDQGQIDLPKKEDSGLMYFAAILNGKPGVAMVDFPAADIVRDEIVQTIVTAIEEYEKGHIVEKKAASGPGHNR